MGYNRESTKFLYQNIQTFYKIFQLPTCLVEHPIEKIKFFDNFLNNLIFILVDAKTRIRKSFRYS